MLAVCTSLCLQNFMETALIPHFPVMSHILPFIILTLKSVTIMFTPWLVVNYNIAFCRMFQWHLTEMTHYRPFHSDAILTKYYCVEISYYWHEWTTNTCIALITVFILAADYTRKGIDALFKCNHNLNVLKFLHWDIISYIRSRLIQKTQQIQNWK